MKKQWLLIMTTSVMFSLSGLTIVSCSTQAEQKPENPDQKILKDEIARIEKIKSDFKLKNSNDLTAEFIKSLTDKNLLNYIDGWKPQSSDFKYEVIDLDKGLNGANEEKKLKFKINVKYEKEVAITDWISIEYQLKDSAENPIIPSDQLLDPSGGKIANNNLKTSAYNNLITSLNLLNDQTYLGEINNDLLAKTLAKNEHLKNIQLTIDNASNTLEAKLVLNLRGNFNKQDLNQQIIIEGFQTYSLDNNPSIQYGLFQLDQKQWFDEKLPITTSSNIEDQILKINSKQWNNLLLDFQIFTDQNNHNFTQASNMKTKGFEFDITTSKYDSKNKNIELKIITKFEHLKYQDQKWIKTNQVSIWNQKSNTTNLIKLYNETEIAQFIIDQTNINETELANYFPSYYLGKQNYYKKLGSFNIDDNLFNNDYLNNQDFKNYYFGTNKNLNIIFVQDSVSANDWNNTLNFNVALAIDEDQVNVSRSFTFENKNKNLQSVLKNKLKANRVQILRSGNLERKIINHLKTKHKSEIDQLFASNNSSLTFKDFNKNQIPEFIWKPILNYQQDENTFQTKWNQICKNIEPSVFENPMEIDFNTSINFEKSNQLNFVSQLYWLDENNAFVLDNFYYQFDDQIEITLTKSNNLINVELTGNTIIYFANSHEEKSIPTKFFFNLFKSDWTNI